MLENYFVWSQKFCSAFCSPSVFYLILYTVLGVTQHNGRPPIESLQFFSPTPIFRFYATEWYLCYARLVFNTRPAHTQAGTPLGLQSLWVMGPARKTQQPLLLVAGVLGEIWIRTEHSKTCLRRTVRLSRRNGMHAVTMTMITETQASHRSR